MEWRHFVTYLSNDPRTNSIQVDDDAPVYAVKCVTDLYFSHYRQTLTDVWVTVTVDSLYPEWYWLGNWFFNRLWHYISFVLTYRVRLMHRHIQLVLYFADMDTLLFLASKNWFLMLTAVAWWKTLLLPEKDMEMFCFRVWLMSLEWIWMKLVSRYRNIFINQLSSCHLWCWL